MGGELLGDAGGLGAGVVVGARVAGYRLEEQVGAGGMAVVFRARDERLGRLVALKIMASALAADEVFRQRFIREWRAAAAVDHPHIIPIYEAGQAGQVLFLAMRFVRGGDVRSLIQRKGPLAPGQAVGIISPMASALDTAHGAGLVHRDVKPANMLIDSYPGQPDHLYLSDFGLSKGVLSLAGLTGAGQFLGTPDYAAPEQIQGLPTSGLTDQYALACAAFVLLTGAPPFRRDDPMAVIYAQLSEPPPRLASRRPGLPLAADQVFARALAKTPQDRYASCGEFAERLREALGLEAYRLGLDAVRSPRHPQAKIAWLDGPRSDTAAAPVPAAAADPMDPAPSATGAGIPGATTITSGPRALGTRAAGARRRPPRRKTLPTVLAGISILAAAAVAIAVLANPFSHQTGRPPHASAKPPSYKLTATLTNPNHPGSNSPQPVDSVAFSADGKTLATGGASGTYLWNLATRRRVATLTDSGGGEVFTEAFSPDDKTLATGRGNKIYLWDVAIRRRNATLTELGKDPFPNSMAFGLSGTILATGDLGGRAYLWDIAIRRRIATLTDPGNRGLLGRTAGVSSVAFSPNGKILATGDLDGRAYVWDVATRRRTVTLTDPTSRGVPGVTEAPGRTRVLSVAFSPSGTILATGDSKGKAYLWDVATWRRIAALTDPVSLAVFSLVFSPNGKTLASAGGDGRIYLWDVATGHRIATLTDPGSMGVPSLAFSPNGKTLAIGDYDGRTYLWETN